MRARSHESKVVALGDPMRAAKMLHEALRKSDPTAFISDDPLGDRVTVDGHFNL
jgi:hypothetical protein